ncbi:MAG: 16S rRNA (adenine(1518)-N(6)/adenine(1519)-N(6))-dimethyltransferase RsmA [Ruminococcus sp.]|nr:16S rRNA (adenine(1518)-N(6)/adenine(1519)-N(6))-dimethyltransferase RsmA [Ruminococcus sp.]
MDNLTNIHLVKEIMERHGFHFSKKLGQNFIINPSICPKIAEMGNAMPGYGVLEIGTGVGVLTHELAKRAERVCAVEVDERLLPILAETVGEHKNLNIIHSDILKCDLNELLNREFGGLKRAVCANLPYYITTPILMYLLESNADIDTITVMVQKEVADKLEAKVGTREAGAITVAVNFYGTVEKLFSVSRGSFIPAPNVDSAVIQIRICEEWREKVNDKNQFFKIVRTGFQQRRKTLINALSGIMGYNKRDLSELFRTFGISETIRIEALSMEELCKLSNALS